MCFYSAILVKEEKMFNTQTKISDCPVYEALSYEKYLEFSDRCFSLIGAGFYEYEELCLALGYEQFPSEGEATIMDLNRILSFINLKS
jgi:hypothetical protein